MFSDTECALLALPVRLGGLGIENPATLPSSQYNISMFITAPLTNQILQQCDSLLPGTKATQAEAKAKVLRDIRKMQNELVDDIRSQLPSLSHQLCLELSLERGVSS